MVFSSIPFLFFFFVIFLITYYLVPKKIKNYVLLAFSLIFYAWGEPIYVFLLILSSYLGYYLTLKITKEKDKKKYLIIAIIINILILGFFKYVDFLIQIINYLLRVDIAKLNLSLPIGISFFTFQIMSYIIDVYRDEVKAEKNFFDFLTYVSMFPQLIAGPIVRYETITSELHNRKVTFNSFSNGLIRFMRGLFKKVLLANNIGLLFTTITSLEPELMSTGLAILGVISFTLQIYFDFSGYSDMAIGMGKMLGFTYLENFNYPYIATSITDFWHRWHISLSTWFKDYLYIPLGGNRCGVLKNIRNILIVWMLTGLWHGASLNFVLWGLYYGIFLILEKFFLKKLIDRLPIYLRHIYTLIIVMFGWILFAITDFNALGSYLKVLFNIGNVDFVNKAFFYYFKNYFVILALGIIFSLPISTKVKDLIKKIKHPKLISVLIILIYLLLFLVTISYLVSDTYNPFLYFRF